MFIKLLTEDEVNFCLDKIDQNTFKNGEDTAPDLEDIKSNNTHRRFQGEAKIKQRIF